jgi:hypothetical protein
MRKELPVILVNKVVDLKRIIGKMEGQGGGEAQGVADPPKKLYKKTCSMAIDFFQAGRSDRMRTGERTT